MQFLHRREACLLNPALCMLCSENYRCSQTPLFLGLPVSTPCIPWGIGFGIKEKPVVRKARNQINTYVFLSYSMLPFLILYLIFSFFKLQ